MDQRVAAISLKIDYMEKVLKKPLTAWNEEERLRFGDHDKLRELLLELMKEKLELMKQQTLLMQEGSGEEGNVQQQRPSYKRSRSDEEFISQNKIDLGKPADSQRYLIHLLEKKVEKEKLGLEAAFRDNCLEYKLERRTTDYKLDDHDNIKLLLAVSGAGKTRMLLELLHSTLGYYFTSVSSQNDFGSGDLALCLLHCESQPQPENVKCKIELLYYVRAVVCNYLIGKGFNKPWQILLAQLHPRAFFGLDLFAHLFGILLLDDSLFVDLKSMKPFTFTAIDEIQVLVESKAVHSFPGSSSHRPFFSPLVRYSKLIGCSPRFLISGTGINFEYIKEAMESSTMKTNQITNYKVVSSFHALSSNEVEKYANEFLQEHGVKEVENIVSRISAFELCHGRPRFVAYILDKYMESKDIDIAIGEFMLDISTVDGQVFPLRFFKRDLDNNIRSLDRIIEGDTLGRIVRDGLLEVILKGNLRFRVVNDDIAAAIRYGLGFGEVSEGILKQIEIKELAVVECLRYFIPFAHIVKAFAQQIAGCPKPQMVGYLLEYLVSFALVANYSGKVATDSIKAWQDLPNIYLEYSDDTQVCFPDHMCGPDIIYKCKENKTVYIVQVKFLKSISKQEAVNACNTTVPERFYFKRKGKGMLKGFEQRGKRLRESLRRLVDDEKYKLQQMLFLHTAGEQHAHQVDDAFVVTKSSNPEFFNSIGTGVWAFLDSVRNNF